MFDASRLGILVGGLVAATLPALAQELPEAERQKGRKAEAGGARFC